MRSVDLIAAEITDDAFEVVYLLAALSNLENVLNRNEDTDHILDEYCDRLEPRLQKRLTALAGNLRNIVFEVERTSIPKDAWDQATMRVVGVWSEGNKSDLYFKDACHKLLHAKDFRYLGNAVQLSNSVLAKLNILGSVALTGTHRDKDWTVGINVPQFAAAAYMAAQIISSET